jgi:hypothetical protein
LSIPATDRRHDVSAWDARKSALIPKVYGDRASAGTRDSRGVRWSRAVGVRESKEHAAVGALAWRLAEPEPIEQRQDQRVEVRLLGRFMRSDRKEFDCESIDASPNGIAFASAAGVQPGERIVAYLNQIGRVEGRVTQIFAKGFAIQMNAPPAKRNKLATQLASLANRQALGLPEERRHERIAPRDRYTILKLDDGREYTATLIDLSTSGAALNVDVEPPVGARVLVGATPAQVVRHVNCGIAVQFLSPLPADEFSEYSTL